MCWMSVHSFSASHGREGQHSERYAQCMQSMSQEKYGEAVVVFDGYVGKSTETTHARRTKEHAGVTVAFTSNMQLTMSKAKFLANKTNKQQFINMLGDQLEMNNCKAQHGPGDADLLIVQKSVESATMSTTILVGDDTDLLILLCYHSSLHSHRVFFQPEPKKSTNNPRAWNIQVVKEPLGPEICTHMLFCMPSLDVIQPLTCVALEKELPSRSSNQVYTFESKLKCSMHRQLSPKMLLLQDCKHWFVCTMGNLQKDLIRCVIHVSARRCLPKHLIFNHRLCHTLQLQQSTTVSVYTFRFNNGKVLGLNLRQ